MIEDKCVSRTLASRTNNFILSMGLGYFFFFFLSSHFLSSRLSCCSALIADWAVPPITKSGDVTSAADPAFASGQLGSLGMTNARRDDADAFHSNMAAVWCISTGRRLSVSRV